MLLPGPAWEVWPITSAQANQLAVATEGLLRALPKRSKETTTRALSRYLPWVAFVSTFAFITWPKVLITLNTLRAERAGVYRDRLGAAPVGTPPGPGGADGVPPDGTEGYARVPTWADYREARRGGR